MLYAITLDVPEPGVSLILESVRCYVYGIILLGTDAAVARERPKDGLRITMPESLPNDTALALRITKSFE